MSALQAALRTSLRSLRPPTFFVHPRRLKGREAVAHLPIPATRSKNLRLSERVPRWALVQVGLQEPPCAFLGLRTAARVSSLAQ
jgi:hypothetical protein